MLLFSMLSPFISSADITYPARLEMQEVEPGIFEVYFVLPVINGKVLKAYPVFPDFCQAISEPEISGNAFVKEMKWKLQCSTQRLYGENIGISGLLGSQINIIVEISTLEGRNYKATLSPSSAYFNIPQPPSLFSLASDGFISGVQMTVASLVFVLLFLVLFITKRKRLFVFILPVGIGLAAGYLLTQSELLRTPGWLFETAALMVSFLLITDYLAFSNRLYRNKRVFVAMIICSALFGADQADALTVTGYTSFELVSQLLFVLTGAISGLVLLFLLFSQGLTLISLFSDTSEAFIRRTLTFLGILTTGVLVYHLSLFWKTPSLFSPVPEFMWTAAAIIIIASSMTGTHEKNNYESFITLSFVTGFILGISGWSVPYLPEFTLAAGGILLILILTNSSKAMLLNTILISFFGLGSGMFLINHATEQLSFPVARSVEISFIIILIISLSVPLLKALLPEEKTKGFRIFSKVIVMIFVGGLLLTVLGMTGSVIPVSLSFPVIDLPLVSLACLLAAVYWWPRSNRIRRDLGVKRSKPTASMSLIVAAVCFLPLTTGIKNPWFDSGNMDHEQLRQVMQQVLSDTYSAFNIKDEERLFEALSSRVDEQLLDNIYLDSRRRLTMGLREGAEVRVENVNIERLGETLDDSPESAFSYPAAWTVTARVKHLKHIHYRKNRYTGTIELKSIDNTWKISKIILNSEDREVIPASTL